MCVELFWDSPGPGKGETLQAFTQHSTAQLINVVFSSTVAPQILNPPDDLTVVDPQDATFSCLATGRPRPTIVWTRLSDMTPLQNQSATFVIVEQEIGNRERRSMLTILGSQPSDAGGYACVAMNEPGSVMQLATLTVHGELQV